MNRLTKEREQEIRQWCSRDPFGNIHEVFAELDAVRADRDAIQRSWTEVSNGCIDLQKERDAWRSYSEMLKEGIRKIQRLPIRHPLASSAECFDVHRVDHVAQEVLSVLQPGELK
jgi:Arc/MetJ-type ribon-helix-helix transcriptional regulator